MSTYSHWTKILFALTLALGACKKTTDDEQTGLFVIVNQSGYDAVLSVFNTRNRQQAPITVPVSNGGRVERTAYGGAGGISYPELYFQGDSVRVSFSDGKQLIHYCTQNQQINGQCSPKNRNLLSLSDYQIEPNGKASNRYTFILTATDYANAR